MSHSTVLKHIGEGIALLTLNRPSQLNALDYDTIDRLMAHLDEIEADPTVRAVILTGAGDRAFSAGADIKGFQASVEAGVDTALREFVRRGQRLTSRLETFPKPVIAAVNGIAFGGGCEVTEAVHLAVASNRATFAKPEIKLGFPPPFGGSQRLPRHVGRKRALQLILTGDAISAQEAERIGIVNAVVPHDDLLDAAHGLARRIIRHSSLAVTACLTSVTRGINLTIDEGLAVEASQFGRMVPTRDIREGIAAFIERRVPSFSGH
jgi:enoyl-CoA hydratase/carnithine racemase